MWFVFVPIAFVFLFYVSILYFSFHNSRTIIQAKRFQVYTDAKIFVYETDDEETANKMSAFVHGFVVDEWMY